MTIDGPTILQINCVTNCVVALFLILMVVLMTSAVREYAKSRSFLNMLLHLFGLLFMALLLVLILDKTILGIEALNDPDIQVIEGTMENEDRTIRKQPRYEFRTDEGLYSLIPYRAIMYDVEEGKYYRVQYESKTELILEIEEIEAPEKIE